MSSKCDRCNTEFNSKKELDLHFKEKQCKNMEILTCDTCKSVFTDFRVLKKHISRHLNNDFQCSLCKQFFKSETVLKSHICKETKFGLKIQDSESVSEKCLNCNKTFIRSKLKPHLLLNENIGKYCKDCSNKYLKNLKICENLTDCKKVDNFNYKCGTCGKKFVNLVKLEMHLSNMHYGSLHKCNKCDLRLINQEEYKSHMERCKGEKPCSCKTCGKLFTKKDYLRKHEYIHSNVLFRCKFCHCAFMREKSFKKHLEGMNCSKSARKIKLRNFNYKKCRICNKDFDEEEMLNQHFSTDHPGENPHQCFCCESCLPTFKDLENHIHLHNTQKYTCNLCGKPYTSQEGFRKHRLKHKGAEYKCQFCNSEFLNERRFQFHIKTCKKNPESAYHLKQNEITPNKKEGRSKQSRQLHWESRIILKRLRTDPNSETMRVQNDQVQNTEACKSFFEEQDGDSNDSNVRGWFDNYYKTEEDDLTFGLKGPDKINKAVSGMSLVHSTTQTNNSTQSYDLQNENLDENKNSSGSDSRDTSSEEDFSEELPLNYNPKKCRICFATFSQEYELLHHFIKLHPKKKAHKCPHCDEECPLFAQLKEHMKTHGIGMGIYNCINCSKMFKNEKKMKSHTIRCKGIQTDSVNNEIDKKIQFNLTNEEYCKRCCKTFHTKCGYRRHKNTCREKYKSNKENKKKLEYNTCQPVPVPEEDLSLPLEKHSADGGAPLKPKTNTANTSEPVSKNCYIIEPPVDSFPCRLCDKKFQYERGLVMHFKSDHPGHKPLVCRICNMYLADKLKEHLKTHGIGEEFVCELCGKRFNQKFLSKIHEMWHQGVEYKCGNCKQKFLNKEKMEKHITEGRCNNRQSLMRLPCDICGKSYRSKFGLSKHYITHTPKELRPVKNRMNCEYCGKWFETNNGLQRHRRIHTGERPFCCRFCSKSFVQEGNCKSHERIHTGEPRKRKKKSHPVN